MNKDVLVQVTGLHEMDVTGEDSPIEMIVPGYYYFRNGCHYVRYEEILDDSGIPTVNYVKLSADCLEVRKKGLVNVHMVFERGKKNVACYTTPFGMIRMGVAATNLAFHEEADSLSARVEYALEMNEEHIADCFLTMKVQSKNAPGFTL